MNEFMYIFMHKHKVLVIIFAAIASWQFVVAVNAFQELKYRSSDCTFAKLGTEQ